MASFFADDETLATPPIEGRAEVLEVFARDYQLIGCTSRYLETEGQATWRWVERWTPWLSDVVFVGGIRRVRKCRPSLKRLRI